MCAADLDEAYGQQRLFGVVTQRKVDAAEIFFLDAGEVKSLRRALAAFATVADARLITFQQCRQPNNTARVYRVAQYTQIVRFPDENCKEICIHHYCQFSIIKD